MKHTFRFNVVMAISAFLLSISFVSCGEGEDLYIESNDGSKVITLTLDSQGKLYYQISHNGDEIIRESRLGLISNDQDFTQNLKVKQVSPIRETDEEYGLKVSNFRAIDHKLKRKSITFENEMGNEFIIDLVASNEGIAFRYIFPEDSGYTSRIVDKEITEFRIDKDSEGWLQPYNKAGQYTPAYEDFYFKTKMGDSVSNPRNPSKGWAMPVLFNVNNKEDWILIAESSADGTYPGTHLENDSEGGGYRIAFAEKDERKTVPIPEDVEALPESELPWEMPWRVFIIGENAGDILLSSLITDLAPPSKIEDDSWIKSGKASWSWWSHPDDQTAKIYNDFTDLAVDFDWEYTLFDAGWEDANNTDSIVKRALSKGIKPLVWGYSADYFRSEDRKKRFREFSKMGIKGVKIDFWCSDRQEVMAALEGVFEDAAKEKLLVNLHGVTMPRGWQRTWPNFLTAEAVLGTESYFYEERFPAKAAEQNTILPFTRNVAGPTDYTPFALTQRKYPRLNTAGHELALSMIYTSGIIHFADSYEVFEALPKDVKNLFKEMPSTWDNTKALVAEPGNAIVLYRKKGSLSYIVGINGTDEEYPVNLDLLEYANGASKIRLIDEGEDPMMEFSSQEYAVGDDWNYVLKPKGGFVIQFINK